MNPNQPTRNTLAKRESTNTEHCSIAALIGLCNTSGIEFLLQLTKQTNRNKNK